MDAIGLRALLDGLPVGIAWFAQSQLIWRNAFVRECIDAHDPQALQALVAEIAQRRGGDEAATHAVGPANESFRANGREFHVGVHRTREHTLVLMLPAGEHAAFFPSIRRLRQAALDFEEIFRHSYDGIFVTDGNGKTLMVNPGCERIFGLKASELIGRDVVEFEKKGWIRPVIAAQVARTGQRISTTQETHTGKTIFTTGIPLFDERGSVRKVIINSRDTTELLQLQDALARARADLRRVDQEIEVLRLQNLQVDGIVLRSEAMRRIATLAARVAKVDATVLITGQSGVGKDVIAQLIHKESARAQGPLIKINCGALPRELLESELFGYEPGAFTGAQRQGKTGLIEIASRGTLFLDEIGDMPLDLQVKLLQVLQDRVIVRLGGTSTIPVDVRVIAATNRDLRAMVADRTFRDDLFYRLNVVPIEIAPLTERRDDIAPLALHFVNEFNRKYGVSRTMSEQAMALLIACDWPGNVRELRNVIERVIVTCDCDVIAPEFLDCMLPPEVAENQPGTFREQVERFERRLVEDAMREYGSTRDVAKALGLSQSSVVRKLRLKG
ncbi:sigma-54 interaction domain-containing protein [Paraburkholderia humisilvae]|uniref:HTH-type transcriptional regulatory protein TyrR n=1 Tax=Paraburkholderia humisilvae TaxID=627669 RepID=A0A6J5DCA3_9BURK|nr:sigma 54-interacting transcriptional regulator [Paraburkholderia humisilvae]CAB3751890.1 Anaerobic nitric oxide reductase transcription regulator NorR [Paraburkholderia humisilvae]